MENLSIHILTESVPIFTFWDSNNLDERYIAHVRDLIEFNDTNDDGVPQPTERATQGTLALASGTWNISDIVNETEDDSVVADESLDDDDSEVAAMVDTSLEKDDE